MKAKCFLSNGLSTAALSSLLMISCVNEIADESNKEAGNTPIQLSTNIHYVKSRVINNEFQHKDMIGLYVLTQPNTLDNERFIENATLVYSTEDDFQPEDTLYFPRQEILCDFISYYPYQTKGFETHQSSIQVELKEDQSTLENYSLSDFMIASTKNIKATNQPVGLTFEHKMAKLYLNIKPKDEKNKITDILYDFPKISLNGFYTEATYNMNNDSFFDYKSEKTIHPHGEWILKDKELLGKEVLLLPQPISEEQQSITLNIDNESYSCSLPTNLILTPGESIELTINFTPAKGIELESIHPIIEEWNKGNPLETENQQMHKQISLADLNFQNSNIYLLLSEKRDPLYEITKEYLCSQTMREQAIIAYPMKNNKADLTKGTVLSIINNNTNIQGGEIGWNILDNSFQYTEGTLPPITSFFINEKNEIVFDLPEKAQSVYLCDKVLIDKRADEQNSYPLVKIGTQYWMRTELTTNYYIDGKKIKILFDTIDKEIPSIIKTKDYPNYYFYNDLAVVSKKLAPQGWKIPSIKEWNRLIDYIQNEKSVLQSGVWIDMEVNNLTGFDAKPIGVFAKSKYQSKDKASVFWALSDSSPSLLNEKSIGLYTTQKEVDLIPYSRERAFSIRCLMIQ